MNRGQQHPGVHDAMRLAGIDPATYVPPIASSTNTTATQRFGVDVDLAADRLQRVAAVAEDAGAGELARALRGATRVMRDFAAGSSTEAGGRAAAEMAAAVLGWRDHDPLT